MVSFKRTSEYEQTSLKQYDLTINCSENIE